MGKSLIYLEDAIDALDEQIKYCDKALADFDISMKDEYAVKVEKASLVAFREQLEDLPSVQPELATNLQPTRNKSVTIEYRKSYYEAIMALDLFTKLFCRNDGENDLVFRCNECLFEETDGRCLVKQMKQKYCHDYKDFGSMGDL